MNNIDLDVKETRLKNGVRIITSAVPHVQSTAIGVWVGVGSRYETRNIAGMSHFIEHLLFKGTSNRSAKDISQAIEGRGGYFNAFTQEENTCYYARVAYDHAREVFDVLGDMYFNASLQESDIDRERGVIIEEIMMYRDHPEHVVQDMLTEQLWKGHNLSRPVLGTPEAIARVSREQLKSFMKKKYVLENVVFTFAGRLDHDDCVSWVRKLCGRKRASAEPTPTLFTRVSTHEKLSVQTRDIEQAHLALGFRLFGRYDKRRYALKVLSVILGENMSSRLFQVIREKHGLAYSVSSSFQLFAETGAIVISAGLERSKFDRALALTIRELNKLKRDPVSKSELNRAMEYITGQMRLALESTSGQMMWLGENVLNYNRFIPPADVIAAVNAVKPEHIQKLAGTILKESSACVSLVCPSCSDTEASRIRGYLGDL